ATSYLTPVYASTLRVPHCFEEGNGAMLEYSPTSAFWICNRIANACYKAYDIMAPTVQAKANAWESSCVDSLAVWDSTALALYRELNPVEKAVKKGKRQVVENVVPVRNLLTERCCRAADNIFAEWVKLEEYLLVKFIDGNVKAQNPDGTWVTNGYGRPENIGWPGYSEKWKRAVVEDHGEILEVKQ
ncbi:MAG: hypothetical protein KBS53_02230, partial [Bacteroidales bacterium]|nr:hypothetical protein [Candidatus Hennigimonas equi]